MNRTSDIRELNVEEIDLVSGGAHASINLGFMHIDASKSASGIGIGIDIGGQVGIHIGSGGVHGYVGNCDVVGNSHGGHAGCTPA